jgi:hypothetical protein
MPFTTRTEGIFCSMRSPEKPWPITAHGPRGREISTSRGTWPHWGCD